MAQFFTTIAAHSHRQCFSAKLLIAVYLLVVHYSVSHTHAHAECQPETFKTTLAEFSQNLDLDDHAEHWHADQHHHAGCTLIPQTTAVAYDIGTESSHQIITEPHFQLPCLHSHTPTKRLTRAPPGILV